MSPEFAQIWKVVLEVLDSWQMKVMMGLIAIDIVLGIAAALRTSSFDWSKLAKFYLSMILPYVLGYTVLYVVITFVIPADQLGNIGEPITVAAVTTAWAALIFALLNSIRVNFSILYKPEPE